MVLIVRNSLTMPTVKKNWKLLHLTLEIKKRQWHGRKELCQVLSKVGDKELTQAKAEHDVLAILVGQSAGSSGWSGADI